MVLGERIKMNGGDSDINDDGGDDDGGWEEL